MMKQKRTHNSQIVKAKENLKLSQDVSSYWLGTNPPIKALCQSRLTNKTLWIWIINFQFKLYNCLK